MHARGTDAIPLPPRPDIEQYRRQAKELAHACGSGEGAVHAWAAAWLARLGRLLPAGADAPQVDREAEVIARAAERFRLLPAEGSSGPALSDTQRFIAWLHGFESWPRFARHIESSHHADSQISRFEAAADAVVDGDEITLGRLLSETPDLITARSSRDHHATLLHYVAANGHETFRQRTPRNAVAIARRLLEAGAEPDARADMYEKRCTTLEMLVSSVHPHAAGVQCELVDVLLASGAEPDGVDRDGSPLMTALSFRYPAAAEALVRGGARIDNVIAAAGLGRADLVDHFLAADGTLSPGVPLVTVRWPSLPPDRQLHLGYALTWAAGYGHRGVVECMLRKGVSASGRYGDGTALHAAAAHGHLEIVRLLLSHGAPLEALNAYGGTVLGSTVWFAVNGPVAGADYAAVARELVAAGARTDAYPGMAEDVRRLVAG